MWSSSYSSEDPFHYLESLLSIYPLGDSIEDPVGVLEYHYSDGSTPRGGVPPLAVSLVKVSPKVSPNSDIADRVSFLGETKVLHSVDGRAASPLHSADQARELYEEAVRTIAHLRVQQNPRYKGKSHGLAIKTELMKLMAESVKDQTFYLMVAHLIGSVPVVVDVLWRKNIYSSWQSIWCTMDDSEAVIRSELKGHAERLTENQAATIQLWYKIFLAEADRRNPLTFGLLPGEKPINISTTNR